MAVLLVGDVADELDVVNSLHLFAVAYGHGEHQFVVLAAIQGTGGDVHVHFFGHDSCLVVNGQILLEDAAAHARLFADVAQFAAESVRDVHHGGGTDAGFAQPLDDVASGFGLQLSLEQVLLAAEVGLESLLQTFPLLFLLIQHLVIDGLLAL